LAPAAELLPGAGKGAWLSAGLAAPVVLCAGWLLGSLSGQDGLAAALSRRMGRGPGSMLLIIYMVWAQLLLTLRLRLCAERMLDMGSRDGSLWFFLTGIAAAALWLGMKKADALARAAQIFFYALVAAGGAVLALSLPGVGVERLLPLWQEDLLPTLREALRAAGVLGWGFWGAFLLGYMEPEEEIGRSWMRWGLGGCLLLTTGLAVIQGNLGTALAAKLQTPFFTLAKNVAVQGAFQRVESLVSVVWLFADLTMVGVLLLTQREIGAALRPSVSGKKIAVGAALIAFLLALGVFPKRGTARWWSGEIVPTGNLVLGFGVPSLIWIIGRIRGRGIYCGHKPD